MDFTEQRHWTIGELAAEAGITPRALRHYDRVGLLVPSERSQGGHRRYSQTDVARLYRIVALRQLDFGLSEIASALESDPAALSELIRAQLARVESSVALQSRLRDRLERLLAVADGEDELGPEQLLETLEAMMTVHLDRIYTGTGDSGETDLADGERIAKSEPALAAADLEEVSAYLAAALAAPALEAEHGECLRRIQNDLLDLGADLSHPFAESPDNHPRIGPEYVEWLEKACDHVNAEQAPLDSFVIPVAPAAAIQLHLARVACRRVERSVVQLPKVNPEVLRYLNRLSDLLFILARASSKDSELVWQPGAHAPAPAR